MVDITLRAETDAILKRLTEVERSLTDQLGQVQHCLANSQDGLEILSSGLRAYRERYLKQHDLWKVATRVRHAMLRDPTLRPSHRRILDVLLDAYDWQEEKFQEIHFSRLVRLARISKSRAIQYLTRLEGRGYIEKRDDGYRHYWKLRMQI